MKFSHSLGFLLIGSVMFFLPQIAPGLCPVDAFGNSVRGTWLHLMGLTQIAIGASVMLRKVGGEIAAWLARWPELVEATSAVPQLVSVRTRPQVYPTPATARAAGDVIPVDFKPAWSGQRAA